MWTTVPPAKSRAPSPTSLIQPPPHTQCATGAYTRVTHITRNMRYVVNLKRSTNAPVMSTGVMMANIIWNMTNSSVGMPLST